MVVFRCLACSTRQASLEGIRPARCMGCRRGSAWLQVVYGVLKADENGATVNKQ